MNQANWRCFLCCTTTTCTTTASSPLENNLDIIFLLRNLLEIPRIQLESQLKECGDNPKDWIRLCNQCIHLTKKARELDQEIKSIEKELRSIQKQVLEKIRSSHALASGFELEQGFGEKIRSFVKCNEYNYLNADHHHKFGFLEGDKLANYLESHPQNSRTAIILVEKNFPVGETLIKEEVLSPTPTFSPAEAEDYESSADEEEDEQTDANPPPQNLKEGDVVVDQEVYLCDHCGEEFDNEAFMKLHVMETHKVTNKKVTRARVISTKGPGKGRGDGMICSICGHRFFKTICLHRHLLTKHKDDPITKNLQEETGLFHRYCSVVGCSASFMKQIEEDRHMEKVHSKGDQGKPHKCRFCGRGFWSGKNCWRHEKIHEVKGKVRNTTKWVPSADEIEKAAENIKANEMGMKGFSLDKKYKCEECGKSWDKVVSWSGHIWREHGIREISCPGLKCGMVFKESHEEFQDHWRRKHWRQRSEESRITVCDICGEDKGSYMGLYEHRRKVHKVEGGVKRERKGDGERLKCEICGKDFAKKYGLECHVKFKHEKVFDYSCPLCGVEIGLKRELKRHLLAKHGEDPVARKLEEVEGIKLTRCGVSGCGYTCFREGELEKHVEKWHGGGNEGRFKCGICGKGFWVRAKFEIHERACERRGKDGGNGRRGRKRKEVVAEEDLKCKICGKEFLKIANLRIHVKFVHEKRFKVDCHLCGLKFRSKANFQTHFLIAHEDDPMCKEMEEKEGIKAWRCEECSSVFLKKEQLDKHMERKHGVVDGGEDETLK